MSVRKAFDSFMNSKDFKPAVDSSTAASWSRGGYSVELLDNGTYRVLWDHLIGNLYDSPGLILSVPPLDDDAWDEDPSLCLYEKAEQAIRDSFEEHCLANLNVQALIADS